MNKLFLAAVAVTLLLFVGFKLKEAKTPSLGYGDITPTVTTTKVSCGGAVSQATTSLWAAGTNYKKVIMSTIVGGGNIYWAFGSTNATTSSGHVLYPVASSTAFSSREITDPNLLGKAANCVADTTSTVSLTVY